jgi:hypothetical protein
MDEAKTEVLEGSMALLYPDSGNEAIAAVDSGE